jgi:RNA polymerase sigma-70 factor (ECF subfamily)
MQGTRDRDECDFASCAGDARSGDVQALERLLESFRPYLLAVAGRALPDDLLGKVGGSDLVQETLLEAHRDFARFAGDAPNDLRAWLRGILRNNLADCARRFRNASKRAIDREQSLHASPSAIVDPNPTPGTCAAAREEADALDLALERLPETERAVLLYRHRDHLPFDEIGRRMGRSGEAARKLWGRALERLRGALNVENCGS